MMMEGSGTESPMDLCGRMRPPLMYSSSLTITSSPSTDTFSMRTFCINNIYEFKGIVWFWIFVIHILSLMWLSMISLVISLIGASFII